MRKLLPLVLLLVACASEPPQQQPAAAQPRAHAPAQGHDEHGALPNVHRIDDTIISGGVPSGDAGFDELARLGVKTVISVDGATPDVARAEARGMRYVHIPITYAEVPSKELAEIARAIRDLPGPIYVHCHHGKHRSPAAAAAAAIALGRMTSEEGVAFMRTAGTAPSYEGLYTCVARGAPIGADVLDAASAEFPAVHRAQGLVAAMVAVDETLERLDEIRAAGWTVPADHPDLVPAAEAGQLADALRTGAEAERAVARGEEFVTRMRRASDEATALEDALVANAPAAQLAERFASVKESCRDCHVKHRDRR